MVDVARGRADDALAAICRRFGPIAEFLSAGMTLSTPDGRFVLVNDAFVELVGRPASELLSMHFQDITHPDDNAPSARATADALLSGDRGRVLDKRYVRPDGEIVHARINATIIRNEAGEPICFVTHVTDMTGVRDAEQRALASEERTRRVISSSVDAYISMDRVGVIVEWNPAAVRMFGWSREEAVGTELVKLLTPDEYDAAQAAGLDCRALTGASRVVDRTMSLVARRSDGSSVPVEVTLWETPDAEGELETHAFIRDITERRAAEAELERLAHCDALTGLANRALLTDRLRHAQDRLRRTPGYAAMLMLDLDRFKMVNDTLGHSVGDSLLVEVARRLERCARPVDTVARLGGDEFVLLLDGVLDPADVTAVAERVLAALRLPVVLPGIEPLEVSGSVGIALTADADQPADDLYREADLALYRAKESGRDRYALFDAGLRHRVLEQVRAERQLRIALSDGLMRLYYQPIFRTADRTVVGSEALVRLLATVGGEVVLPNTFIRAAEESGLIAELDQWVLRAAVGYLEALRQGPAAHAVSINISPRSMVDPRFAGRVADVLLHAGVGADRISIEVTERTLTESTGSALRTLARLRADGVRVGLDDFGTGISSLGQLQRLPLDFIKIDGSFVAALPADSRARATVEALTNLAHAHGITVTAEGVETEAQFAAIADIGCDHAQGHLLGRAEPGAAGC